MVFHSYKCYNCFLERENKQKIYCCLHRSYWLANMDGTIRIRLWTSKDFYSNDNINSVRVSINNERLLAQINRGLETQKGVAENVQCCKERRGISGLQYRQDQ